VTWRSTAALGPSREWREAPSSVLRDSLAAWTLDPRAESLHVTLDELPGRRERDWLVALRRAGAAVTWSSKGSTALALTIEPANDPSGGVRASFAAPVGSSVVVSDSLGVLDTVSTAGPSASLRARALLGVASVAVGADSARAVIRDSLARRGVVVLGSAGWEAKFIIAALEESGWNVSARLAVAPGIFVRQGSAELDTSVTGVVVALDSTAARDARDIARFVNSGGGLVLAGGAARGAGLRSLAVGATGVRVNAASIAFSDSAPRRALGFFPISAGESTVPIESRDGAIAVAARRVGAGRVIQEGYDATWRWRMQGGSDSPEAHRAWWSQLVGSAADRDSQPVKYDAAAVDPAPLAAAFAALGAPTAAELGRGGGAAASAAAPALRGGMLLALFAMLLAEWASRRLRGRT
jgi:hypothetical protein